MAKMATQMPAGASNAFASGAPIASDVKTSVPRQSGKSPRDSDKPVNSRGAESRPDKILGGGGVARPLDGAVAQSRVMDRPVGQAMRTSPGRDMAGGGGHMGDWADREHPVK